MFLFICHCGHGFLCHNISSCKLQLIFNGENTINKICFFVEHYPLFHVSGNYRQTDTLVLQAVSSMLAMLVVN